MSFVPLRLDTIFRIFGIFRFRDLDFATISRSCGVCARSLNEPITTLFFFMTSPNQKNFSRSYIHRKFLGKGYSVLGYL